MRDSRLLRGVFVGLAAVIAVAIGASPATADTTHPFLREITLSSGTGPQPFGVDSEGNLLVWLGGQEQIGKFDANGNPVNFSGLGTNRLDGKGGFDCPATPSDCDRVPGGEFHASSVAVDPSTGPAGGDIYVADSASTGQGVKYEVEVFDSTGRFRGVIDESQASPATSTNSYACSISVSPIGTIFIDHCQGFGAHIDAYAPVDGNPAHDEFIGQIRGDFIGGRIVADTNYLYVSAWSKFPLSELSRPTGSSVPMDFSAEGGLFGSRSQEQSECNCVKEDGVLDPVTHHMYLLGGAPNGIEEWDENNKKVGPNFGDDWPYDDGYANIGGASTIAFDHSDGPDDGDLYMQGYGGLSQIAVFGPPVVIPDLSYDGVVPGHTSAHIEMTVDPAGAGPITDCHIEYGFTREYGHTAPCVFGSGNKVSVDLSGLFTEATYHYKLYASNANGHNYGGDQTFHTAAVLGVETEPASEITPNSAKLNGKLNPDGMATSYHFEYGVDTGYRESTAPVSGVSDTGEISVAPTEVANLQPGRTYHYRLVAENSLGTTYGPGRTFTAASRPTIAGVHATDVSETSAVLRGLVYSHGSATTYRFEYGSTLEYGRSVPVPDGDAGSEEGAHAVSQEITGLQSGVVYHYRLVAENTWGKVVGDDVTFSFFPTSCPNSLVRDETGSNYLPDCRAYELVSPESAGAVQLLPGQASVSLGSTNGASPLFSRPIFHTEAPNAAGLAESPSRFGFFGVVGKITGLEPPNSLIDRYVATRTSSGWVTTYPGLKGNETVMSGRPRCDITLDTCIDYNLGDLQYGAEPDPNPYAWDVSGRSLGRWPTDLAIVPDAKKLASGWDIEGDQQPSGDFSHYVFSSREIPFASGGLPHAPGSVYDNDIRERSVTVASWMPDGSPIPQDAGNGEEFIRIPAVSTDGSHILMSTVGPGNTTVLYMRVDDAVTYEVSEGQGVKFVAMSRDGSTVVFTSDLRLTPDDTDNSVDMFSWSEKTGKVTRVSQGNGNGNSDECDASWIANCGVAPVSPERPDLDNLIAPGTGAPYFYSPEQLDPNNPGVPNEKNLYTIHDGTPQLVTSLDPGTEINRIQISPDNEHAAFVTASQVTGYDSQGWQEMYTYDVNTDQLRCASCLPSGEPPSIFHADLETQARNENLAVQVPYSGDVMASQSGPFMSNDGRVAFATSDALVPQDTNRLVDVYEFVDGRPQLISAGSGQRDHTTAALAFPPLYTGLEAFSANGVDLYFSTFDSLVPQDRNGPFVKFYDARTNGGFINSPPLLPCAAADECHGEGAAPPAEPQVGTLAGVGTGGNVGHRSKGSGHARRHKKQRRRAGHHRAKRGRHAHRHGRNDGHGTRRHG